MLRAKRRLEREWKKGVGDVGKQESCFVEGKHDCVCARRGAESEATRLEDKEILFFLSQFYILNFLTKS